MSGVLLSAFAHRVTVVNVRCCRGGWGWRDWRENDGSRDAAAPGYRGPLVSVGVFTPGRGACWECLRDAEIERRDLRLAPGQDEDVASPRMPWNPANAVTAGLSGGLLAHAALMLLCGVPRIEPGCRFGLNLMLPGDPIEQRAERHPDCPACGARQADGTPTDPS